MLILFVFIKVHGGQLIWCDTLNNFFILISNILLQARKEITMLTYFFYTIIDFWLVESKARVPGLVSTMLQPWTWNSSVVVQRPFVWLSPRPRRPGLDSSNGVIEFFFSHLCGRQFSLWASTYLKIVFFFFLIARCQNVQKLETQKPATWKEENHITISSVNCSSLLWDLSSPPMDDRHSGQVLRHTLLNHPSMHTLWNLCKHGKALVSSSAFNRDKQTQQYSPSASMISDELDPTGDSSTPCLTLPDTSTVILLQAAAAAASLILGCHLRPMKLYTKETNFLRTILVLMED
jgi:hypothetical protein